MPGRLAIQDAHRTEQVEWDVGRARQELTARNLDTRCGDEAQHEPSDQSRGAEAECEPEPDGDERDREHDGEADGHDPHRRSRPEPLGEHG